jgi:hypothetical protein
MADVTLYNTDTVPVHLDEDGHLLGAGEHGRGNPDDPVVKAAIEAGRLVVQPDAPAAVDEHEVAGDLVATGDTTTNRKGRS